MAKAAERTKQVKFILGVKQFCKVGCCEGFKIFLESSKVTGLNPMLVMCITCKHLIRDNNCPHIFGEQNGLVDPKASVEEEPPKEILT